MKDEFAERRQKMVKQQIEKRGVSDPLTLKSLLKVPRHLFVPPALQEDAYIDSALYIENGQTISQPYIVGLMTEAAELSTESTVLEIGTGSGYAAAVLAGIVSKVYTIERIAELAKKAKRRFKELGLSNIEVKIGDGTLGWPEKAPFDAIIVTAGAPIVPASLIGQLKDFGRLIIPVGDALSQSLLRLRKAKKGKYTQEILEAVRFVPLIGKEGWEE